MTEVDGARVAVAPARPADLPALAELMAAAPLLRRVRGALIEERTRVDGEGGGDRSTEGT